MSEYLSRAKKAVIGTVAAAAVVGGSMAATATPAEAGYRYWGHRHHDRGAAVAAGVIGGLALGAIASQAYGAPAYAYGPGYGPSCWTKRVVRYNRFGERVIRDIRTCR